MTDINEEVLSRWAKIFEPDHRTPVNIWVLDAGPSDWQRFLDWVSSSYPTIYSLDGAQSPLPLFAVIKARRETASQILRVDLGGFEANSHFFSDGEIEIDVLPEDVNSTSRTQIVFDLMKGLALLLGKEAILAPECGSADNAQLRAIALCKAASETGALSLLRTLE